MFLFSRGARHEGGGFPAISVPGKQASSSNSLTTRANGLSSPVRRAAGKKTGEPPPGHPSPGHPRTNMTASDSRLAVPGHGKAAGGSCGGRMFALVARILFWVSLWASVVARTEASPPIVLRGNPLAVRTSWSVSAVLMVAMMAGGVTSASAKRCDTVIADLPLSTTRIDWDTCDEGESREDVSLITCPGG